MKAIPYGKTQWAPCLISFYFLSGLAGKTEKEKEVVKKEKGKENEEEVPRHFLGGVKGGRKQKKEEKR